MRDDQRVPSASEDVLPRDLTDQLLDFFRGIASDDFSFSVRHAGQRWSVQFCDRALGDKPELATGSSFAEAWRKNPNVKGAIRLAS